MIIPVFAIDRFINDLTLPCDVVDGKMSVLRIIYRYRQ